jgi:hypothetical protein
MRRLPALFCAILLSLAPGIVAAEPTIADRNAARALADKGADLFEEGKYIEAIEQFRQADALVHAPPHVLYMARANVKLGNLVEAHKLYEAILIDLVKPTSPAAFREAQEVAKAENDRLLQRIPTMKLNVSSPDIRLVKVTIDGKVIQPEFLPEPILVNPGAHTVEATGRGLVSDTKQIRISEGDKINMALSLRWQGSLYPAIIAFGVGGAALTVGAVTGIVSLSKVSDLEDRCPEKHCLPADQAVGDSAATLGTVSTVGFIAGTVFVGAGVALAILRPWGGGPSGDAEERLFPQAQTGWVRARVGLGTVALEGAF